MTYALTGIPAALHRMREGRIFQVEELLTLLHDRRLERDATPLNPPTDDAAPPPAAADDEPTTEDVFRLVRRRLSGAHPVAWEEREQFFCTAAKALRQALVDLERRRRGELEAPGDGAAP